MNGHQSTSCSTRTPFTEMRSESHPVHTTMSGSNCGTKLTGSCHQDCLTHCKYETKTPLACSDSCAPAHVKNYDMTNGVGALIVWFLIIFIITWLVLYSLKPSFVLKDCYHGHKGKYHDSSSSSCADGKHGKHGKHHDKELDTGKSILAAAIIALIIIIVIWLIKMIATKKW